MKNTRRFILFVAATMVCCTVSSCKADNEEFFPSVPPSGEQTTDNPANNAPESDRKGNRNNVDNDKNGDWLEIKFPR